jgi:hypothetical protein
VDTDGVNSTDLNGHRLCNEREMSVPHELHIGDELVRLVFYQF